MNICVIICREKQSNKINCFLFLFCYMELPHIWWQNQSMNAKPLTIVWYKKNFSRFIWIDSKANIWKWLNGNEFCISFYILYKRQWFILMLTRNVHGQFIQISSIFLHIKYKFSIILQSINLAIRGDGMNILADLEIFKCFCEKIDKIEISMKR